MGIGMGMGMGMRMGPLDDEDQGEGRESQPDEPPQGIIIIFNSSQEVAVAASSFRGCCLICLCSLQEKSGEEWGIIYLKFSFKNFMKFDNDFM